jgi:uncharacterized protein YqfB (UPF0267 family)
MSDRQIDIRESFDLHFNCSSWLMVMRIEDDKWLGKLRTSEYTIGAEKDGVAGHYLAVPCSRC